MMKFSFQITTLFFAACALFYTSCKEDEASPTELLTAPSCWKMSLLEGYDKTNNLWVAVPVDDCEADNCNTFKSDQTFVTDEGATKCDPNDPQSAIGAWSISDDGKKLSISDAGTTDVGTITELTGTKLVLEAAIDNEKVRITYQAD
ncbi:MAG TPA: lipocalin family protein [Saprospiraceae bacterium]|nr:lipocalin family protein [Saprospiraceae bacterium]